MCGTQQVNYATKDGTATAPSDYGADAGTLVFEAGESVKPLEVKIVDDEEIEDEEQFYVELSEPRAEPSPPSSPDKKGRPPGALSAHLAGPRLHASCTVRYK